MSNKLEAWDALHSNCSHILKYSWTTQDSLTIVNNNLRDAYSILENATLTVAQINALSEVIYWAYCLGKEEERNQS